MHNKRVATYIVCALLIALVLIVGISAVDSSSGAVELGLMLAAESEDSALSPKTADTTVVAAVVLAISATAAIIITKKK